MTHHFTEPGEGIAWRYSYMWAKLTEEERVAMLDTYPELRSAIPAAQRMAKSHSRSNFSRNPEA